MRHNQGMRVAYISDLHIDVSPKNEAIFRFLSIAVQHATPDVFVVAGDIANTESQVGVALAHFSQINCPRLFVPGNHDVWVESKQKLRKSQDSAYKHDVVLPQICRENGFHYLPASPVMIGEVAFVGTVGWYDYTMADPRLRNVFSSVDYDQGEFRNPNYRLGQWNDCRSAVWFVNPDAQVWYRRGARLPVSRVFQRYFTRFMEDIGEVVPQARSLVAVTHTLPFVECLHRTEIPDPFDAYQGSVYLGSELVQLAKKLPVTCICGHKHRPFVGNIQGVQVLRSPLGYLDTYKGELLNKAMESVGVVEV